jgi:hypothetical protein
MTSTRTRRGAPDPVIEWVRRSDPIRDEQVHGWSRTHDAALLLRRIVEAEGSSAGSRSATPRRRAGRPLLVAAALLVIGGTAAGAGLLLGGPAPSGVQRDLAGVDEGMPADLRLNPDARNARLVARSDGASLYAADLGDGGYCAEIVTPEGHASGAVCTTAAALPSQPIGVTVPFVDPVTIRSPFVVGGRVNAPGAVSLDAVFADGTHLPVTLGDDGFYVFAVTADRLPDAHRSGLSLVATDAGGAIVATADVPPTDFSDPEAQDAKQPIFVSTISTHTDLTKVLGIEGSVNVPRAASLHLRYPDGTVAEIPLEPDGTYRYDLPVARQDDLFSQPGELVALDAKGRQLASAPVAAVAYWQAREPG